MADYSVVKNIVAQPIRVCISMPIQHKIDRLRAGEKPRVLDLFAGCGGISLGFHSSGFEIAAAVEFDAAAARSHAMNFHGHLKGDEFERHALARDITATEPEDLLHELGYEGVADELIDVVVGGPPCQAFARVGRAKLREVAAHPEAFLRDPRGNLYVRYIEYVRRLKPLVILMENVPDVLNYGGHNIAEETCEVLADMGYKARYTTLNAVYYGVPEMRERMFLVAFREELSVSKWFPEPSHHYELPQGYHNSRRVAMKHVKTDLFDEKYYFHTPPKSNPECCQSAVTAEQALSDLPVLTEHLNGGGKRGARHFNNPIPYPTGVELNDYQQTMRSWLEFTQPEAILDHVIRSLPRDYAIFKRMNPGDQYPEAFQHAMKLFRERVKAFEKKSGKILVEGDEDYERIKKETVPPYDPGKFPNKWRKMEGDQPARTLMAHLGKDSYSHIHYDSNQARTISVREAARLQSFPDGFVFQGPMNPAFRQIGNAVPPLMSKALATNIMEQLE